MNYPQLDIYILISWLLNTHFAYLRVIRFESKIFENKIIEDKIIEDKIIEDKIIEDKKGYPLGKLLKDNL